MRNVVKAKGMISKTWQLGALALVVVAVGCSGESQPPLTPPVVNSTAKAYDPKGLDAGWVVPDPNPNPVLVASLKTLTQGHHGQSLTPRNDPFALLAEEKAFDTSQSSERVLADTGWRFDYEEPEDKNQEPVQEEQPYRRLAGVIVGESVLALIDMGDGRPLEIIRPGQRIPNSEWTVVSIDEEKAILRRSGNKLPKQIVVRLESPPNLGGMGTSGTGGRGGGPNGGPPGGPAGGPPRGGPGKGGGGGGSAGDD